MAESAPAETAPLSIGELARRTEVSRDTLRFYERRGLLEAPERRANGYRFYPPEAIERVVWIRRVLAAGFTIDELASILAERRKDGAPCRRVRALGAAKLAELEERRRELEAASAVLRELLAEWDERLAATAPGERAGLLDALVARNPPAAPLPSQPSHRSARRATPARARRPR
jgi:DNA-binding transcriptional MerR regulator